MNQSSTNIIKLRQSLLGLIALILMTAGCVPKQSITEGEIAREKKLAVPYKLALHPGEKKKVALFLPSSWDSMAVFHQKWARPVWKEGYDILVVAKPNEGDFYRRKSQDYYSNRLGQVFSVLRSLEKENMISTDEGWILITAGESSYLAPELARQLEPDHTFLINGLPFGPLAQLEMLQNRDTLRKSTRVWLQKWGVDSLEQLPATIKKVRQENPEDFVLGDYTNMYWLSYEQSNFTEDYAYLPGKVTWILFEEYPLLQPGTIQYIKALEGMRSSRTGDIRTFSGTGLYKEEQTRDDLGNFFKNWARGDGLF